jgi:translation initiation factor eIF-2B subunit delta
MEPTPTPDKAKKGHQKGSSTAGSIDKKQAVPKSDSTKPNANAPKPGGQLTGKDLKLAKKADKQARRAQEKQTAPTPVQVSTKGSDPKKGEQTQKDQARGQKQGGRDGQKPKPVVVSKPLDERRTRFYGHLHARVPKRTTVGAHKDVHPAIISLGLQMSTFAICGSNARCAATLLALKKVCFPLKHR